MHRFLQYTGLFVVVVLLQVLLFDNLMLSAYLIPLVYISFIVLLPMNIPTIALLFLGALMGITIDFASGGAAINTISTIFIAFIRPVLINITINKDTAKGPIPYVGSIFLKEFLNYTLLVVGLHSVVFFFFEALGFNNFEFTLLKIVISTIVTSLLVWLIATVFKSFLDSKKG